MMKKYFLFFVIAVGILVSCRKGEYILPPDVIVVNPWDKVSGDIKGFFLLNEGNMGSNKASLDYYDYETGVYTRNIYGERNPNEVKDLGDVGNDIKIYGGKLWAVINVSNYVEVMDVETVKLLRNSPFQTAVISLSKMVMPMSVLTPVLSR